MARWMDELVCVCLSERLSWEMKGEVPLMGLLWPALFLLAGRLMCVYFHVFE